jgi:hypothetical protein
MQRQLRLGDILDDYCPRERRVTNHAIVAMLGSDVKQTRCTTCDAEHEYKEAKVPRQRRKTETPAALYAAVLSGGPKRVAHGPEAPRDGEPAAGFDGSDGNGSSKPEGTGEAVEAELVTEAAGVAATNANDASDADEDRGRDGEEEGPVHRPLIRASLPRPEGTPPPQRPGPDFTIRQPGGRPPNRFRSRHQRGGQPFQGQGNRGNGNMGGPQRGGMMRHGNSGRPQGGPRPARRDGPGRKRSK